MKNILSESGLRLPREVQLKRVYRVIDEALTENQRQVLTAHYFEKQTVTQIAQARGVHKSTVSRTLHRAEKRLRDCLRY
ncbi:MAG: sigma-70 family RNA polymerase sigma factor [Oscillospiraceae bacterium]|nr:sigma-70 family RNA polymerase sigma factor [Oscillospiraceae bacterium]MBQ8835863.1 sigma-70 family RNA polymerase sigma factor [Oscillospiraceae bacterium]